MERGKTDVINIKTKIESAHFKLCKSSASLLKKSTKRTDVKKIYTKLVIDNKINYKLVEDYIADLYSNAIDINFLLGLRKIFNDVETFKELQRGQDENK